MSKHHIFDKQVAHVGYNDKAHTYTNTKTDKKYTSVTTLIHKFVPPFKGEYWSTYKAVKDVIEKKDPAMWYRYKRNAGGWEGVVAYYNKHKHENKSLNNAVDLRAAWYLDSWDRGKEHACELGSRIHAELEGAAYTSQKIKDDDIIYDISQENILAIQDFNNNRVYPELLIFNDEFMVAGQVDLVHKKGKHLQIVDYKTCKDITKESFRGETMFLPLQHLPNANYWHYALQLSMYGYILEMCGYIIDGLTIFWIHGKDKDDTNRDAGIKEIKLPYLKDDVISILKLN